MYHTILIGQPVRLTFKGSGDRSVFLEFSRLTPDLFSCSWLCVIVLHKTHQVVINSEMNKRPIAKYDTTYMSGLQ